MSKKYHYCYVTTNLINGKQYIGDHSTDNLEDGYLGSGKPYFENAKRKYKKENFKKEILEFFDTKQEAFDAQEKWINEYNTLSPLGYNISPTGGHGVNGGRLSEESRKKISIANKGKKISTETRKKISIANKGRIKSESECKKLSESKIGKLNPMFGKSLSYSHRKKISDANKGKITWNKNINLSEETKIKMRVSGKSKIFSETHKSNISLSHKNRKKIKCEYCNKELYPQHYSRWHGDKCKEKKDI